MVTGASGLLGRAIVRRLAERDEVRATVRRSEASDELRSLGAKVAVRTVDDPHDLLEILPRVHTLVHLVGGVDQPDGEATLRANHASTVAAVAAAKQAGVRRFVLLSATGADPASSHPFLRAKGLAEEVVVHSGLEYAVVRSAHVYGLGGLWFTATVVAAEAGFVIGPGDRRFAPVLAEDVAAVVASIDDRGDPVAGVWRLEGPDPVTADELYRLLDGLGRPDHLLPADAATRLEDLLERPIALSVTELLASPSRDLDLPEAAESFGVPRTRLVDGLRRTADRAADLAARVARDA
ncbi:MAG TPA: NAD(P)H-binding protein [Actinomycetota bacterium]|nr:NAD(P)H-binding protein [Actinomycetota bacterium]